MYVKSLVFRFPPLFSSVFFLLAESSMYDVSLSLTLTLSPPNIVSSEDLVFLLQQFKQYADDNGYLDKNSFSEITSKFAGADQLPAFVRLYEVFDSDGYGFFFHSRPLI